MKKVMIGILIVIPIIIVAVVSLVSVFVSQRTHIAVDSVSISADYKEVEFKYDGTNDYALTDLLYVNITPESATDRDGYEWTIEDLICLDETYSQLWNMGEMPSPAQLLSSKDGKATESCGKDGYLRINAYCTFRLRVSAETQSASCGFYVVGYKLETVTVNCDDDVFIVGDSKMLNVEFAPIDARVDYVHFTTDDDNVVVIDKNGVMTAVGEGTCNIVANASVYEDGKGEDELRYVASQPITITVQKGSTAFGNEIAFSGGYLSFASLGISAEDVTDVDGVTLTADGITLSGQYGTMKVGGNLVKLSACDEDEIIIENAKMFAADNGYTISSSGKDLHLSAKYKNALSTDIPSVTWTSSDESVATVNASGVVNGVGVGTTVITATANGKVAEIEINVRELATILLLKTPKEAKAAGIAGETVNASTYYVDVESGMRESYYFDIEFSRPLSPENDEDKARFYAEYEFSAEEIGQDGNFIPSDKMRFVGNRAFFVSENITEACEIKVIVKAKYPKIVSRPEYTTKTFIVKVVDGVYVTNYAELKRAAEEDKLTVCFGSDILRLEGKTFDDQNERYLELNNLWDNKISQNKKLTIWEEKKWDQAEFDGFIAERNAVKAEQIIVTTDIYGNGHILKGLKEQYYGTWIALLLVKGDDVTISNLTVRACEATEEITNAEDAKGLTGACISAEDIKVEDGDKSYDDYSRRVENLVIEYCILENAGICSRLYSVDVRYSGCIIRNSSETAMYCRGRINETGVMYVDLTLENVVMSNMIGTAMSLHYDGYSLGTNEYNTMDKALEAVAEGKNHKLTQKGFLDIYNWQEINVLNLIPAGDFSELINVFLRQELKDNPEVTSQYSEIYDRSEYFHLGFISTGISEKSFIENSVSFEDERIQMLDSKELLPSLPLSNSVFLFTYGKTYGDLGPGSTYKVNPKLIARLRGEN